MNPPRPHPFDMVFGGIADTRFGAAREVLGPAPDVHEFVLAQPVIELMRELRPDEGIGDAMNDFVAFVHAAYRFWADGATTVTFDDVGTAALCVGADVTASESTPETALYIQVAPRLVWGQLDAGANYEPLDGWFAISDGSSIEVVACFGVHPARPGLSVLVLGGERPTLTTRPDTTPLFAPTMPGGGAAGLHAIAGPAEMLLLAWRARDVTEGR